MVEYAPPWDPMQTPHEMPLSQVRKSAIALANLLDESKDEQVLKDACLGLCQLFGEGIQNDRIQAILEANVVPKLVALLRPTKSRSVPIPVQSAALQVLGNVACGDDRQTQVLIDSDALPCLRSLLSSSDRNIRKEVCWIVSNITESSHQVQDVLDADILPPLLKLLDNQDIACREDATWVLFNLSSNRDPNQISYLADKNGVRALCNLLACPKDLDVLWKGCGTVAAVALKGLRNILICGHSVAMTDRTGHNKMASLVADAHGVERIEVLTNHDSPDVRNRARLILERIFGTEQIANFSSQLPTATCFQSTPALMSGRTSSSKSFTSFSAKNASTKSATSTGVSCKVSSVGLGSASSPLHQATIGHAGCSCSFQQQEPHHTDTFGNELYNTSGNIASRQATVASSQFTSIGVEDSFPPHLHTDRDLIDAPGSSSGSSTDSDPEDDDSDSDLIPPPPPPCTCLLCSDSSPLVERRPRGGSSTKVGSDDSDFSHQDGCSPDTRYVCDFCSGNGRLGDGRAGLAAKLGRAVRLGHTHCLAVLLSRMTWSQRYAATEAPALLHPGGGPSDSGIGNSLPAFVLAAQLGKPECLSLLLQRCQPDLNAIHGKKRLTALAWAAHKGYVRCTQLLIENGANPASRCGDGVTALHLAASGGGHAVICKLLLDNNAPVNAQSSKKQTPLCLASQKGAFRVVQLLLDHGADANNDDEGKYTPLHLAASKGFDHCVDLLLKSGARVDAITRKGVTPLHYAVQGGHADVVRLLIAAGAQVNCTHKPLLLIAADDGNVEVVRILLDARASIDCKANIRAMLDKSTEVSDYLTPLHLAASRAHQEVVELLLNRNANVNEVTTKHGWSALDFAVLNGHAECAVALLKHGATVTNNCKSIGRNNWTLVQHAAHHGAKDVVRLLIQRLKEQRIGAEPKTNRDVESFQSTSLARPHSSGDCTINSPTDGPLKTNIHDMQLVNSNTLVCSTDTDILTTEPLRNGCHHHQLNRHHPPASCEGYEDNSSCDKSRTCQASHRYDPQSLDGDEAGFGTVAGYTIDSAASVEATSIVPPLSKSRRRVLKEDRQSSVRSREMRKRETEACEARDRLEEAMNQRSISKLMEAIAHVSKLVLHLETNVGNDVGSIGKSDGSEISLSDRYSDHGNNAQGPSRGVGPNGCLTNGECADGGGNRFNSCNIGSYSNGSLGQSSSNMFSAPLAMEVGLGNEVQKARRILAGLLAEEKRVREEKEREAADSKRDVAQAMVRKATTAALQGGDPRSLSRAISRATRTVLDRNDVVIVHAKLVVESISNLERNFEDIRSAMRQRNLDLLCEVLPRTIPILTDIQKKGGDGAAQRIFAGGDPLKFMNEAEKIKTELQEKRERALQDELRAKDLERSAKVKLEEAMNSNDIAALEVATKEATDALLSKESDLRSTIEVAKRGLAKWVKGERRKLKQARNSNDPIIIERTADAVAKLGLQSLRLDIEGAKEHAQKLREQSDALQNLSTAIASSDPKALNNIRQRLTTLGMFSDAEKARSEVERLQRAKRARTLLESSIKVAEKSRDVVRSALSVANEDKLSCSGSYAENNRNNQSYVLTELASWDWPDTQRLHELSERAKKHGQPFNSLCAKADSLVKELASLGRRVLDACIASSDAQAIASIIAGYEKSFILVPIPDVFDHDAGKSAIIRAKDHLAEVQAMDQQRIRAESAQVKVEYAMATSRRSLSRHRDTQQSEYYVGGENGGETMDGTRSSQYQVTGSDDKKLRSGIGEKLGGGTSSRVSTGNVSIVNFGVGSSSTAQYFINGESRGNGIPTSSGDADRERGVSILLQSQVKSGTGGNEAGADNRLRSKPTIDRHKSPIPEGHSHSPISSECGDDEPLDVENTTGGVLEPSQQQADIIQSKIFVSAPTKSHNLYRSHHPTAVGRSSIISPNIVPPYFCEDSPFTIPTASAAVSKPTIHSSASSLGYVPDLHTAQVTPHAAHLASVNSTSRTNDMALGPNSIGCIDLSTDGTAAQFVPSSMNSSYTPSFYTRSIPVPGSMGSTEMLKSSSNTIRPKNEIGVSGFVECAVNHLDAPSPYNERVPMSSADPMDTHDNAPDLELRALTDLASYSSMYPHNSVCDDSPVRQTFRNSSVSSSLQPQQTQLPVPGPFGVDTTPLLSTETGIQPRTTMTSSSSSIIEDGTVRNGNNSSSTMMPSIPGATTDDCCSTLEYENSILTLYKSHDTVDQIGHGRLRVSTSIECSRPNMCFGTNDVHQFKSPSNASDVCQRVEAHHMQPPAVCIGRGELPSQYKSLASLENFCSVTPSSANAVKGSIASDGVVNVSVVADNVTDLGLDFESENFGFDINSIVDDENNIPSDDWESSERRNEPNIRIKHTSVAMRGAPNMPPAEERGANESTIENDGA